LGLAAACGFRVFVPLLLMSLAARAGALDLAGGFAWLAGTPALIAFSVATLLEIGAYFIPWVDNFLDSVATPAAVIAGVVVTASVVTGMEPWLRWSLAAVAGGGVAGAVQLGTVGVRQASVLGTGGLGNPLVSGAEAVGSAGLTALALALPAVALALVLLLFVALWRFVRGRRRRRATGSP
jgi:hypothetical protein